MTTPAIATLCLILGGGVLIAYAVAEITGRRRLIGDRLASLAGGEPAPLLPSSESPDWTVPQDLFKQAVTLGMTQTWGVRRSGVRLLAFGAVASGAALTLALAMALPLWLAPPLSLALGYAACRFLVVREQQRAEIRFTEYFPSALDTVTRVLRAGLPTTAAIRAVAEEAPDVVAEAFADMADQLDIGVAVTDVLAQATQRIQLSDFRFFTVSVSLQHGTGGNLASTLEILADIIRRRRGVRKKAKALTAEVRMSSYILGAVPVIVLVGLSVVVPTYLAPLFHDPRGRLILGAAAINLAAGFVTMRTLMRRAALD